MMLLTPGCDTVGQFRALTEVLKDKRLAAQLRPSMAIVEQLLRQKDHLSGEALANAAERLRGSVSKSNELLSKSRAAAGADAERAAGPDQDEDKGGEGDIRE
jgi:hypothetical protein